MISSSLCRTPNDNNDNVETEDEMFASSINNFLSPNENFRNRNENFRPQKCPEAHRLPGFSLLLYYDHLEVTILRRV